MTASIFNLVFPAYVNQLTLGNYTFRRVHEYADRVRSLQHLIREYDEFQVEPQYGTHAIIAEVFPQGAEPPALLKWGKQSATHLDDVLLILSLFTMRHVWAGGGSQTRWSLRITESINMEQHYNMESRLSRVA